MKGTGKLLVIGIGAIALSSCTTAPYSDRQQLAIGYAEESIGNEYTVTARELTSIWTFTQTANFTLSFEAGEVRYNEMALAPGCYTGTANLDDVLIFQQAEALQFAYPSQSENCIPLDNS